MPAIRDEPHTQREYQTGISEPHPLPGGAAASAIEYTQKGVGQKTFYLHSMADVHNKKTRSYNMSRIRSGNTKPEMLVRKFLHANGFRYSLHKKTLAGKPDIVLPKYKTAIFIHGCFWHGHKNCKYFVVPKTRTQWWLNKIDRNKANDEKAVKALKKDGWKVIVVWECALKSLRTVGTLLKLLPRVKKKI